MVLVLASIEAEGGDIAAVRAAGTSAGPQEVSSSRGN